MELKEKQDVTMKHKTYLPLAAGIYLNYAILGMATIIVSQYSSQFQALWHTDVKGISTVIAMIGIGRLLTILIAGYLSDRLGRKGTMLIGMVAQILFLAGLFFSTNLISACIAALFMGATNSFGDTASYPALTDAFQEQAASMNSLVKAAMSLAQFVLPFIVAAQPNAQITLVIMVVVMVLDIVLIALASFAPQTLTQAHAKNEPQSQAQNTPTNANAAQPSMLIDGSLLIIVGFTLSFTFYIFSQYAPNFGSSVLKLGLNSSKSLISWYAMASLISVFITSSLVTRIKPIKLIFVYTLISFLALLQMVVIPSADGARLTAIAIGFFAAGGIWQLGLTLLSQYFPAEKGKVTGYYSFATALTFFVGPLVSSFIIDDTAASVLHVFEIDTGVTLLSLVIVIILMIRNRKFAN
ncbi:MFS transporter [Lactiplantibacillus pentosus]|uniref:MFS transporter n=1 Tax=Lactiplantibacillus pentosus TaxID=1589 RepID=UPI0013309CF2|nr:MFS transporter [Lactiplantibacillus pentosus]MBQ0834938.1 MFS transporter [Lactiplantibacillus pentosus]MBU7464781.1 MFS transporter [Lactiplantibacillus pentosus]MBU7490841.1 MFS transporter [Lactiplantibacillus pentosus]MBU7492963.1 MFS transporter [Lactiplantibacillus pentosus]MBU7518916.1 MFS transporter [Lactiplantibacillus pentosus]